MIAQRKQTERFRLHRMVTIIPSLILLASRISAQDPDYTCYVAQDTSSGCETLRNGVCDDPNHGGSGGETCKNQDCIDCNSLCRQFQADCYGCLNAQGCYYCPGDATCYNSNMYSSSNKVSACQSSSDYLSSVFGDSPDACVVDGAFTQDPLYEGSNWMYEMINVVDVWENYGFTGNGVTIRINDDGVYVDNLEFDNRFDDVDNSCPNYVPINGDDHGTAVAGIVLGNANNDQCATGIAYEAKFNACNFFVDANVRIDLLEYKLETFDISQNSIGLPACYNTGLSAEEDILLDSGCPFTFQSEYSPCLKCNGEFVETDRSLSFDCEDTIFDHCKKYYKEDVDACLDFPEIVIGGECNYDRLPASAVTALENGVTQGRDGKGTIFTFASGNAFTEGDDVNFNGWTNSRFAITVGAVGKDGYHADYSSGGAALVVVAPAGADQDIGHLMTAGVSSPDSCDDSGQGSSFACPVVTGVIALMLEANPDLSWRDVQGIIARTSRSVDDNQDDTQTTNGAGIWHSNWYGFGIIDAMAAVEAALNWDLFSEELQAIGTSASENAVLSDSEQNQFVSTIQLDPTDDAYSDTFEAESTVVFLDLSHYNRGDLEIELVSPSGTKSVLHPGRRPENNQLEGGERWKLMTVRNWGEDPTGSWQLKIRDLVERVDTGNDNIFRSWKLIVYGRDTSGSWSAPTIPVTTPPTRSPTNSPTKRPTNLPTRAPTDTPTRITTKAPTKEPTILPTRSPTKNPTNAPVRNPTAGPTDLPTKNPTNAPIMNPTAGPTDLPTKNPTNAPIMNPTAGPTDLPTKNPTKAPTIAATNPPTSSPTKKPTITPTKDPTKSLTGLPTIPQTNAPTKSPTNNPTHNPTNNPTKFPTNDPTVNPTSPPTKALFQNDQTGKPTGSPTKTPTNSPTRFPTNLPSKNPTNSPTRSPTNSPTTKPSPNAQIGQNTDAPTKNPTSLPTRTPTNSPTNSRSPSLIPTNILTGPEDPEDTTETLLVSELIPENFSCEAAMSIPFSRTVEGSITSFPLLDLDGPCLLGLETVGGWYQVIGNGNVYSLTACSLDNSTNVGISVFTGDCSELECIEHQSRQIADREPRNCQAISFTTTSATVYNVLVSGLPFGAAQSSSFHTPSGSSFESSFERRHLMSNLRNDFWIRLSETKISQNSKCGSAKPVSFGGLVEGSTLGLLTTYNTCEDTIKSGSWFTVEGGEPTQDGAIVYQASTCNLESDFYNAMSVYKGDRCGSHECVDVDILPCPDGSPGQQVFWSSTSQENYQIFVHSADTVDAVQFNAGSFQMSLTFGEGLKDSKDTCAASLDFNEQLNRYFLIVADENVVHYSADLEDCKDYLFTNYKRGLSTPRRMIVEVLDGEVGEDPYTVGGQNQGGGVDAGFNKFWMDWDDIYSMTAVAEEYLASNTVKIDQNSVVTGTTSLSRPDITSIENSSCGIGGSGIWYHINGTGAVFQASTCLGETNHKTRIHIYSGDCNGLTCIDSGGGNNALCDNDKGSVVNFQTEMDADYYILVTSRENDIGQFGLEVKEIMPSDNNECDTAIILEDSPVLGSTLEATVDFYPGDYCGTPLDNPGVWYEIEGTGGGMKIGTCQEDVFDSSISVFKGACNRLECVAGSSATDPSCTGVPGAAVSFLSEANTKYLVYVHGKSGSLTTMGDFTVTHSEFDVSQANEFCTSAISIPSDGSRIQGSLKNSTQASIPTSSCGTEITNPGLWYRFRGSGLSVEISACSRDQGNFDVSASVFVGGTEACGSLTCMTGKLFAANVCSDAQESRNLEGGSLESAFRVLTQNGTDYYVFVHGTGADNVGDFELLVRAEGNNTITPILSASPSASPSDPPTETPIRYGKDMHRWVPINSDPLEIPTDYLEIEIIDPPKGNATIEGYIITYVPPVNFSGDDTMTINGCIEEECYQFDLAINVMGEKLELKNDQGWNKRLLLLLLLLLIPCIGLPLYLIYRNKQRNDHANDYQMNTADESEPFGVDSFDERRRSSVFSRSSHLGSNHDSNVDVWDSSNEKDSRVSHRSHDDTGGKYNYSSDDGSKIDRGSYLTDSTSNEKFSDEGRRLECND